MVQKLEAIKGGGGSIRVGTVGTIGSLMTRELESSTPASRASSSPRPLGNGPLKIRTPMDEASSSSNIVTKVKHKTRSQNQVRVTVTSSSTPKRQKQKAPFEDVGNSQISKGTKSIDFQAKSRSHNPSYNIPMLGAENIHLEKTPIREKSMRRGANIVDIVDINCGNSGGSLSNRLKKLGFSKLSQSFM